MPKTDIPLESGWSQVPDEHGGQPRVNRAINLRVEAPGRLGKSPGTVYVGGSAIPTGSPVDNPLAFGVGGSGTFLLAHIDNDAPLRGLSVYVARAASGGDSWALDNGIGVAYDEAPRVRSIFANISYSYEVPGILDIGNGELVVVAEGLRDWTGIDGSVTSPGNFSTCDLQWALVSAADGRVKASGNFANAVGTNQRCFAVCAGKYVVAYISPTQLGVFEFQRGATVGLVQVFTMTTTVALANNLSIDAAVDPSTGYLVVIDASGKYFWIDPNVWTLLNSGTFASVIAARYGSFGVDICDHGKLHLCWASGVDWRVAVFQLTGGVYSTLLAPVTIHSTINGLFNPGPQIYRANVKAWYDPALTPTTGAAVSLYVRDSVIDGQQATGVMRAFSHISGVIPIGQKGFDLFGSIPASKPEIYPVYSVSSETTAPTVRCWAYPTAARSLRSALYLTQGVASDTRPRLAAVAFHGSDPGATPNENIVGPVNASYRSPASVRLAGQQDRIGRMHYVALLAQKGALTNATNVYLASMVEGEMHTSIDGEPPESLQMAVGSGSPKGSVVTIASALPGQFATSSDLAGAHYPPRNAILTAVGSGTAPAAGTYYYIIVREWIDSNGDVHRSPPSDPVKIVLGVAGNVDVAVYDDPWHVGVTKTRLKIYRSKNGGQVFYLVTPSVGVAQTGTALATTFRDDWPDGALSSHETLYTQGARGGLSGRLETWGPPPCRCIWSGTDRMIVGGLEHENRVRWSNLFFPGEGVSWPEDPAFFVELPQPVTAVAALDGAWIAFSASAVYLITGQGPDASGIGSFEAPRPLSTTVGARSWRSLLETPQGIMFQSADGQIYLVQRGTFVVSLVSAPIRDSIAQAADKHANLDIVVCTDKADPWNWIVGATYDPSTSEAWFSERWGGRRWVYQTDVRAWRAELSAAMLDQVAVSASVCSLGSYIGPVFVHIAALDNGVALASYGYTEMVRLRRRSEAGTFRDFGDLRRTWALSTNDIDVWHGKIRRAWLRLHREIDEVTGTLGVRVGFAYDGKRADQALDEAQVLSYSATSDTNRFLDVEVCPSRFKANQVRVVVGEAPNNPTDLVWYLIGLSLELEGTPKGRGPIRYASGSSRST